MILTVASGKGGTGKTTVSVNLALVASAAGRQVHLCDCDVEEPNAHLFLSPNFTTTRDVTLPLPVVDQDLCAHCGKCSEICEFNAIASMPTKTIVFADLCHSCSGCWLVCPEKAIGQGVRNLGTVSTGSAHGMKFSQGKLQIGETQVPPLVEAVIDEPDGDALVIRDAPPGATCPAVATLHGSDFVLLVTEPTPFGLHDLEVAVELVRDLGLPFAVVVNRDGIGDDRVVQYCAQQDIKLFTGLPFERTAAEIISRGELLVEASPVMVPIFAGLLTEIEEYYREVAK
jgi:MinD superfamily P-loop ATPase